MLQHHENHVTFKDDAEASAKTPSMMRQVM
jgi:hypothetical protein